MLRIVLCFCLFFVTGCGLILDFDPRPIPSAPDASFDFGRGESDASFSDARVDDAESTTDASISDGDAGMRRCEDTTMGICIRVDGVPLIADWVAQFNWTVLGGSVYTIDWMDMQCIGGIRAIDADTTECEIAVPDPGTPVIDRGIVYIYPIRSDGISDCTTAICPGFPSGYRLWISGIEYPTDPSAPGGIVFLDNRTALDGMHRAVHINLP